jgi:UDP-3-O-[3-hydroxymyristoyl] glucosamine N-acyltransferase
MKAGEIAAFLNAELVGDPNVEITRVAALESAGSDELAFLERGELTSTGASCVLISKENVSITPEKGVPVLILVAEPKLAFAKTAEKLAPSIRHYAGSRDIPNPTAIFADSSEVRTVDVGKFVTVGENSYVAEGCAIGDGTRIGANVTIEKYSTIHQNCVLYDGVHIGRNCVIHSGVVIGADGFGYVRDSDRYVKFPQIGTVVIEDNVEIGANSCVDRGALGETRIGEGTKIDNLVQIAHNVQIGKRVIIASQTGISGSTIIEDDCVIGGQVGMGDHARVQSGAVIGSQAGVLPGKIVRPGVWWGTPVQPLEEYKVQNAHLKAVGRLREDIRAIKKRLDSSDPE